MKRIVIYGASSASIGAIIAVALLAYDYLFLISPSGINIANDLDALLFFALCPSSLALMALENTHGPTLVLGLSVIFLANAVLYGVVGCLIGCCRVWVDNRHVGEGRSASN